MQRVIVLVLDSFGIGALPDASDFSDVGANTLKNIAACHKLQIPNLLSLGLNKSFALANGYEIATLKAPKKISASFACAKELSPSKDTTSGHWEMCGVPVLKPWGYFKNLSSSFPEELMRDFIATANLSGILGNKPASGTEIINELGDKHVKTKKPIVYTSADSVLQIAAHEEIFGLNRLYDICKIARKLVDKYSIARVIARPFIGANKNYARTANRRDYSMPPPAPTLLDKLIAASCEVIAIGKISDIFAGHGISKSLPANGNMQIFDNVIVSMKNTKTNTLIFANFVDFDMLYGHRRDIPGYAKALEDFDARLPELFNILLPNDIVIITADHGCDPTYKGTDHTREYIPILLFGSKIKSVSLGVRTTFADIGQTIGEYFNLPPFVYGKSFLKEIYSSF